MNTDRVEEVLVSLRQHLSTVAGANMVVSASVIGYTYNYVHGGSWFNGQLHFEDRTSLPVKFRKYDLHERDLAEETFKRTLMLKEVQRVTKVWFITDCAVKNIILVCYEYCENITTWLQKGSSPTPIGRRDDPLHPWWAESIRSLLLTIQNIHSHGLYHGQLSMGATYGVSQSEKLKIVGVAKSLDGLNPSDALSHKLADLTGFRDWLRVVLAQAQRHNTSTIDMDCFLSFFDSHDAYPLNLDYNQLVKKLTDHPFILSPRSRIEYCFEVDHAYITDSLVDPNIYEHFICSPPSQQSLQWRQEYKKFKVWKKRVHLCYKLFMGVHQYPDGNYKWTVADLVRFLRNMRAHYVNDAEVLIVDKCMRTILCPGFLSFLHEHHMKKRDEQ